MNFANFSATCYAYCTFRAIFDMEGKFLCYIGVVEEKSIIILR